jgi:polar amino acid transport system substrate-binding protein
MKFFSKKIILILVLLITGCDAKQKNEIIMGTSADYPPFESLRNGEIVGLDIDIARYIAEKNGYKLVIKDMDFSSLIPALNSGMVDFVISAMSSSLERMVNVDFSKEYFYSVPCIISKKENNFISLENLENKVIGAQLGTVLESFVKLKLKNIDGLKLSSAGKVPQLIEELKIGRIDAIMLEQAQASKIISLNDNLTYNITRDETMQGYSIAFAKNSKLKEKFNQTLDEMKKNGELENIKQKWFVN